MQRPNNFVTMPEKWESIEAAFHHGAMEGQRWYPVDEWTVSLMWDLAYQFAIEHPDSELVRAWCEKMRLEIPRECTCAATCRQPCRGDCGCVYCEQTNGEFGFANAD